MPDGRHEAGYNGEPPPDDAALWRGYYECAEQILKLYAENKKGYELIAYELNLEGWAFRERENGLPRALEKEDIRRVIHNWPEFGGVVLGGKARNRNVVEINADTISLLPERAVFPIDLLVKVAKVLRLRSHDQPNHGIKRITRTYALNGMVYCAHCEQLAIKEAKKPFDKELAARVGIQQ